MSIIASICSLFTAGRRLREEEAIAARLRSVKTARSAELLAVPGVCGVGCGEGELIVYVTEQHKDDSLPDAIDGFPVRLFHR